MLMLMAYWGDFLMGNSASSGCDKDSCCLNPYHPSDGTVPVGTL